MMEQADNFFSLADIVMADREYIFDDGTDREIRNLYLHHTVKLSQELKIEEPVALGSYDIAGLFMEYRNRNFLGEPTSALVRKVWFEAQKFDDCFAQLCDYEYWLRAGIQKGIIYIPEKLARFHVHSKSLSSANRKDSLDLSDTVLLLYKALNDVQFAGLKSLLMKPQISRLRREFNIRLHEFKLQLSATTNKKLIERGKLLRNIISNFDQKPSLRTKIIYLLLILKRKLLS
jgi:hypothetical protein